MARQNLDGQLGAFALGVIVGLVVKQTVKELYERVRAAQWHREYERTVAYGENLPDSLERREPPAEQIRYGGTGALGVSPASAPQNPK